MSRVDDAMRRAASWRRDAGLVAVPSRPVSADMFISPWGNSEEPSERGPDPEPAAQLPKMRPAASSPFDAFALSWRQRFAVGPHADPTVADQFRRLAAMLLQVQRDERLHSLIVTSAAPADGKTLTALNLAMVLSTSYKRRVLLVEGDLRRPAISRALGLDSRSGLSEIIKSPDERPAPVVTLSDTLALLPAGCPDPDPLSGLTSRRMQAILKDAAEKFDWVIIDTPPLASAADASVLCPFVDAAIVVVRAGCTPYAAVQQAVETLGRDRIIGVVLNGAEAGTASRYGGYYDNPVQGSNITMTPASRASGESYGPAITAGE